MSCGHCPREGRACRGERIPRLCQLVDPTHPDHRPGYLARLDPGLDLRQVEPETTVPLAKSLRLTAEARRCPYRSAPACACQGAAACGLRGGVDVSAHECWDCVRRYGP